jgi:AcrR family transcriptional regulator
MINLDKRVKRTHKLLATALIELAYEKSYADITIKDITERAEVAYITFFRHFHAKEDLLIKILQDAIHEVESLAGSKKYNRWQEAQLIFERVQANPKLFHLLLINAGTSNALKNMKNILSKTVLQRFRQGEVVYTPPEISPEIAAHHVAAALLALIEWWLENDQPHSPETMANIYVQMILSPVYKR